MSAVDCKLGPRLLTLRSDGASVRVSMATRKSLVGPVTIYTVAVALKSGRKLMAEGWTAQEAADHMERIIGGEG